MIDDRQDGLSMTLSGLCGGEMSRWHECLRRCDECAATTTICTHRARYHDYAAHDNSYERLMTMTIGPVRYGVRVGAVSPPPPGYRARPRPPPCCWPAAAPRTLLSDHSNNSADIISCANRLRISEDAPATSDQPASAVAVRDHDPYDGKCLLRRCALVRPQVYTRLAEYAEVNGSKEDYNLDRLPKFRFGGNRATADKRGTDSRLKDLTERLKRGAAPVPPPRVRRTTPPVSPQPTLPPPETNKEPAARLAPLRSASFSQVDYCSDDNKYVRRRPSPNADQETVATLPRSRSTQRSNVVLDHSTTHQAEASTQLGEFPPHSDTPTTKNIPEVEITSESPEKTPIRPQDSKVSNQEKRRDKFKRRKGIYLSQWPGTYQSSTNVIPQFVEDEDPESADKTTKLLQDSIVEITKLQAQEDKNRDLVNWNEPYDELLTLDENIGAAEWPSSTNLNHRVLSQSPENKDLLKVSQGIPLFRSDSLSEGEPDLCERKADQFSLTTSDISDCESRLSVSGAELASPNIPRRYSKRPLRGPYGQMLEAEMKKPDSRKNVSTDLKFLEDLSNSGPNCSNKNKQTQCRSPCNSSFEETYTKDQCKGSNNHLASPKHLSMNKRKVSADNLVVDQCDHKLVANHQRTTSSPSKLEAYTNTVVSSELLEQLLRGSSEQLAANDVSQQQNDTRTHVLIELYENEKTYVESLDIISTNYWEPLKKPENSALLDSCSVEEIFAQIPFLLNHHRELLEQLKMRLEQWDAKQTVGDIFLEMFSQEEVIENYTNYVNNWKRSRDILKNAQQSKPAFGRFLEMLQITARQHSRKLALDSLLIKPIQKFPKYELLLQRLIKHTADTHPDYDLLLQAHNLIHEQLLKINCTEREALDMEQLREIENLIEGVGVDLASPDRQYIRYDMVVMSNGGSPRKERALFLFNDLLLITGIKRRSGTINKKITSGPSVPSNLDANKYKLMMKVPLEDVEIIRSKDENLRQMQIEIDNLNEDIGVLNQITELSWTLHCNHVQLDEILKDMLATLNKQLAEQHNSDLKLSVLDLTVLTQNGIENVSIVFPKAETRTSWEESLMDAKAKLILSGDRKPIPEMIATVPIRKTRAGLQFTCAAPTLSENGRDIWVCNSDGYVGQVCVLTLNEKPEPTVTSCNGVCSARILCIASVPGPGLSARASTGSTSSRNKEKLQTQKTTQFDSSSSSDDEDNDDEPCRNADPEVVSINNEEPDKLSTMWLGTEDGSIHIYNANDNIRIKKNKIKLQLGSPVLCIIYLENKVFCAQANGNLMIYERDTKGGWNTNNPKSINVTSSTSPISKMVVCNGKIFCACGNTISVFNPQTLSEETSLSVTNDTSKPISCMLISGNALWLSLQNSAIIKCYHAHSFEFLNETNVAPAVTKMLTSCDDIIRQHKAACLRVTALVQCKDLLWIGTSAGVLLTMPVPHIATSTTKLPNLPTITGVPHGHTGHVRILTSVEMPPIQSKKGTPSKKSSKGKTQEQPKSIKYLVISGGDGYEDFRTSNLSEVAGREDSTNHLLLWNI